MFLFWVWKDGNWWLVGGKIRDLGSVGGGMWFECRVGRRGDVFYSEYFKFVKDSVWISCGGVSYFLECLKFCICVIFCCLLVFSWVIVVV